jgi:hypothetical protein
MTRLFSSALKAVTASVLLSGVQADAQNIIDDTYGIGAGGFELGAYERTANDGMLLGHGSSIITGWTVGNIGDGILWLGPPGHSMAIQLGINTGGSISTTIPTVPGAAYYFSFVEFSAFGGDGFDGFWFFGDKNGGLQSYDEPENVVVDVKATSAYTTLGFVGHFSGDALISIDNVSVTQIPEPQIPAMLACGAIGVLLAFRRCFVRSARP